MGSIVNNYNKEIYFGGFDSKKNIANQFEVELGDDIKILIATYDCGDYDGSAFIIFKQNGKYYEVNASHCSCYGLEGQWMPEEISFKELKNRAKRGALYSYGDSDFAKALDIILKDQLRE